MNPDQRDLSRHSNAGLRATSRLLGLLRLVVGLVAFFGIVGWVGTERLAFELERVSWPWLLAMPLLWILNLVVGGAGLFALFRPFVSLPLQVFLRYHFVAQSLGAFLPWQIGESSLVIIMKNHGVTLPRAVGLFLVDKVTTLIVLCAFGGLGMFTMVIPGADLRWLCLVLLGVLVIVGLVVANSRPRAFLRSLSRQESLARFFIPIRGLFSEFRSHQRALVLDFVLTVVRLVVIAPFYPFIMFLALGTRVPFGSLILISSLIGLVSLIPITAQGLGIVELSAVYLYSLINVEPTTTATVYLIARPLSLGFSGLILTLAGNACRFTSGNASSRDSP